jgi:hypothetical protein
MVMKNNYNDMRDSDEEKKIEEVHADEEEVSDEEVEKE